MPRRKMTVEQKAIGIIAEYNPFHNGHAYLIDTTRAKFKDAPIISVMSGDFVQRGEAAILDKWTRAQTAVECGVDLVLELPTVFCIRSAEYFALGGVEILKATGLTDRLCFGVETTPRVDENKLAAYLNSPEAAAKFSRQMQVTHNYGAAWKNVAEEWHHGAAASLEGPNNILALSYRRAILQTQAPLKPVPLLRRGTGHNETELSVPYSSATALRKALYAREPWVLIKACVPRSSYKVLKKQELYNEILQPLKTIVAYELANLSVQELYLRTISDNGLCFRMLNNRDHLSDGWNNYLAAVTNKRYPIPTLKRIFLQLLLHENRSFWQQTTKPAYIRVLAFNERGRELLHQMKTTATLPVLTKIGGLRNRDYSADFHRQLQLDARAVDLYQLLNYHLGNYGSDFTTSPLNLSQD